MGERRHRTDDTAADEVLKEFEDAELKLDDGEQDEHDREAADAVSPSEEAQESVQPKKRGGDGR
ncbi:hypothetical protein NX801_22605 [Streptomyces sp. LP05-1]|uniref:YfhD family protein n=1 Tax=Streptomyces pyxinae TaxID=2970734 RepID=A0ABT2CLU9_9ACTN|nr:hypothetical protein [Streptomyces sp. LP05-1]MCS0638394.1 hypothetical protein [Streptomyces sp. LP05-1]